MSNWVEVLPLVLIVALFWFLILRPARAQRRAVMETQNELSAGDKVMMTSGIFGEIVTLNDDTVQLRIAANTVIEVKRQAIASVERSTPDVAPNPSTTDNGSAEN